MIACPECGGKVGWDYACHTYPGGTSPDGRVSYMACMPCDSAVGYMCASCSWSYTHGLNPGNPRSEANDQRRPEWMIDFNCDRLGFIDRVPGVPSIFDDDFEFED